MGALAVSTLLGLAPLALGGHASANTASVSVTGLQQGARGDSVRAVQQALVNQGFPVAGGADGIFGAATTAALKGFQTTKGLAVTGVVDDATAGALGLVSGSLVGLAQGGRGEAVRTLQRKLIAAGIAVPGGADGIFGAGTATALEQFQTNNGLPATGTVDAATAAALDAASVDPGSVTTVPADPPPTTPPPTTTPPTTTPTTTVAPPATDPAATAPATTMPATASTASTVGGTIVGLQLGLARRPRANPAAVPRDGRPDLARTPRRGVRRADGIGAELVPAFGRTARQRCGRSGHRVGAPRCGRPRRRQHERRHRGTGGGTTGGGSGGNSGSGTPGATSPLLGLSTARPARP